MIDVGSYTTRAGYAGEDTPKVSLCMHAVGSLRSNMCHVIVGGHPHDDGGGAWCHPNDRIHGDG